MILSLTRIALLNIYNYSVGIEPGEVHCPGMLSEDPYPKMIAEGEQCRDDTCVRIHYSSTTKAESFELSPQYLRILAVGGALLGS